MTAINSLADMLRKAEAERDELTGALADQLEKTEAKLAEALKQVRIGMTCQIDAEKRALAAEAALRAVRDDIMHPRNHKAIVDTIWHSDIETTVDFIEARL